MNKLNFLNKFYNVTFYYLVDYVSIFIFYFPHKVENSGLTWNILTLRYYQK